MWPNPDSDSDPAFTLMRIRIRIPLLIKVLRICDHWSTDPPRLPLSIYASVVSVWGPPWERFEPLHFWFWHRIQLLMRIRIRLKRFCIRIRNPGFNVKRKYLSLRSLCSTLFWRGAVVMVKNSVLSPQYSFRACEVSSKAPKRGTNTDCIVWNFCHSV
jgi:hypothetical protein